LGYITVAGSIGVSSTTFM